MKEDVLEQVVDDYLKLKGYYTQSNVRYCLPKGGNYSDIDVIGFHPKKKGVNKVWVVCCKAWQGGFDPYQWIEDIKNGEIVGGKRAWKSFHELAQDARHTHKKCPQKKWTAAFHKKIKEVTKKSKFFYVIAVTKTIGKGCASSKNKWKSKWDDAFKSDWGKEWQRAFKKALKNNPVKILTLQEIINEFYKEMTNKKNGKLKITLASSAIGRLLQLFGAAKIDLPWNDDKS